jgi:site-specific DNA recombinase
MHRAQAETETKLNALVDSLADMGGSGARAPVTRRIEQLNREYRSLEKRMQELEGLSARQTLGSADFDLLCRQLTVFGNGLGELTVEQKRAAVRALVRKVIWDGGDAHVVLFGVPDDELPPLSGVEHRANDAEESCIGTIAPPNASKARWGEDSK